MLEPVAGVEYDARATMTARFRRWIRNPAYLVGIVAFLAAFVVQSGELGSSDTTQRLAATHSFWTSTPAVDSQDYPEFGIHGRGGRLYGWYGVGQSVLMLPADVIGTGLERLPIFGSYDADPTVRDIVVSYATNILICVLSALICLRLLGLFGFRANERIAGALALIFCTTFLHYTQNLMENNFIFLLTSTDRAHVSIQVVLRRRPARFADRVAGSGRKPAHEIDDRAGFGSRRAVLAAGLAILEESGSDTARTDGALYESGPARLSDLPGGRSRIPVVPVRVGVWHLHRCDRARAENAPSGTSKGVSLRDALPRRLFRSSFHAGEVGFPVRSSAGADADPFCGGVEAVPAGHPRVSDRMRRPAAGLHLFLREIHCLERRFRVGRPVRFDRGADVGIHFRAADDAASRGDRQSGANGGSRC